MCVGRKVGRGGEIWKDGVGRSAVERAGKQVEVAVKRERTCVYIHAYAYVYSVYIYK